MIIVWLALFFAMARCLLGGVGLSACRRLVTPSAKERTVDDFRISSAVQEWLRLLRFPDIPLMVTRTFVVKHWWTSGAACSVVHRDRSRMSWPLAKID